MIVQAYKSQNERQEIKFIGSLAFHAVGKVILRSQACIIYKRYAANPITVGIVTISLSIVLLSGKIPHKIAIVHMPDLVTEEKTQIFGKSRFVNGLSSIGSFNLYRCSLYFPPSFILIYL